MKENNKIIANFMGYTLNENNEYPIEYITVQGHWDTCSIQDLNYHKSWDWLMPVVEKIFKDFYKLNPCPIYLKINIEKALNEVNIEAVYNACVEFIKWYNQNLEKEK